MEKKMIIGLSISTFVLSLVLAYLAGSNSTAKLINTQRIERWAGPHMSTSAETPISDFRRNDAHQNFDASTLDLSDTNLSTEEINRMLTVLINDEYKARAEYLAIIDAFGEQTPFIQLVRAETNHANALSRLFNALDLDVPVDTSVNNVQIPNTVEEAYTLGIQAEKDNIELYEKYLKLDLPDQIRRVFENLMNASKHHLATFEAYASGEVDPQNNIFNQGGMMQNRRFVRP